jgi:hypothetical protein
VNTVPRNFAVRGKQVHLNEVLDVAAVKRAVDASESVPLETIAPELAIPSIRAFEAAGWNIVPRKEAAAGAKIYLRPNGSATLGTNRLTVRVSPNWSDEEACDLLRRHGFTVVDKLKLASNLYVVTPPSGTDSLEAAQSLAAADEVVFAEPELIEVLGHR